MHVHTSYFFSRGSFTTSWISATCSGFRIGPAIDRNIHAGIPFFRISGLEPLLKDMDGDTGCFPVPLSPPFVLSGTRAETPLQSPPSSFHNYITPSPTIIHHFQNLINYNTRKKFIGALRNSTHFQRK